MGLSIVECKLDMTVINHLVKVGKDLSFLSSNFEEVRSEYSRGKLKNRKAILAFTSEGLLVGYLIYGIFSLRKAYNEMKAEGDEDIIIPNEPKNLVYIDYLNISMPFRGSRLGSTLVSRVKHYGLPILLQAVADSELFWIKQGFKDLEGSYWYLLMQEEVKEDDMV